jgi:hypothetical protein
MARISGHSSTDYRLPLPLLGLLSAWAVGAGNNLLCLSRISISLSRSLRPSAIRSCATASAASSALILPDERAVLVGAHAVHDVPFLSL